MSRLFSAKRADGIAEWRIGYEFVQPLEIGAIATYDKICDVLDRARDDLNPIYRIMGRAAKELRRHDKRSLECVPGIGYRVLHPTEHELQARRYHRQGHRKMTTSLEVVKATDLDLLTEADRQRSIALAMVLQGMCSAIGDLQHRQRRTEQILAKIPENTGEQLAEQKAQMAKMTEALRAAGILRD